MGAFAEAMTQLETWTVVLVAFFAAACFVAMIFLTARCQINADNADRAYKTTLVTECANIASSNNMEGGCYSQEGLIYVELNAWKAYIAGTYRPSAYGIQTLAPVDNTFCLRVIPSTSNSHASAGASQGIQ